MKYLFLLILFFFVVRTGHAQGLVSDVRIRMLDSARLEILYNLNGPADSIWFEAEARFGGQLYPNSKFLYGDVGPTVRSGINRRIVWNLYDEGQRIKSDIRVRVLARGLQLPGPIIKESLDAIALTNTARKRRTWPIGPGWAGVSAVLPGVGNMFVNRDNMNHPELRVGLRPLATVGFYGLVLYGLNQSRLERHWYDQYTRQKNAREGETYYQLANTYHHRAYIAGRAAALIWLTDVTLTGIWGWRNRQPVRRESRVSVGAGTQGAVPVAKLRLKL